MPFKLNNLPGRTEKPRDKGTTLAIPMETLCHGLRRHTLFDFIPSKMI
jgi:hypothetical protein